MTAYMTKYLHTQPIARRPAVELTAAKPRCADGAGTFLALFFSDDLIDIGRAKAICRHCPLAEPCLNAALDRQEPWGVWGGELLDEGRIVRDKRPPGRPPRIPRPTLVIDEMGVVA